MGGVIFCNGTEERFLPSDLNAQPCHGLESMTGADLMLSVWDAPATFPALIRQHLNHGAQLVQVKRGADLMASRFDGRLYDQLARMKEHCKRPTLVPIGRFEPAEKDQIPGVKPGTLLIDGKPLYGDNPPLYQSFCSIRATWQDSGGYWEQIPHERFLKGWCEWELDRIAKGRQRRFVERSEAADLFVLDPEERTIASFPGIGPVLAKALWDELGKREEQSLLQAFVWMTDPEAFKVTGWGEGKRRSCQQHLGAKRWEEAVIQLTIKL